MLLSELFVVTQVREGGDRADLGLQLRGGQCRRQGPLLLLRILRMQGQTTLTREPPVLLITFSCTFNIIKDIFIVIHKFFFLFLYVSR